MTYVAIFIFR